MDTEKIGYWLAVITFIIALIFFLWYVFGGSPTLDQTLIAFIASYTALFIYLDGKISKTDVKITDVERNLTNKLEDVERRLSDKIDAKLVKE